jgi:hypothetical protein
LIWRDIYEIKLKQTELSKWWKVSLQCSNTIMGKRIWWKVSLQCSNTIMGKRICNIGGGRFDNKYEQCTKTKGDSNSKYVIYVLSCNQSEALHYRRQYKRDQIFSSFQVPIEIILTFLHYSSRWSQYHSVNRYLMQWIMNGIIVITKDRLMHTNWYCGIIQFKINCRMTKELSKHYITWKFKNSSTWQLEVKWSVCMT